MPRNTPANVAARVDDAAAAGPSKPEGAGRVGTEAGKLRKKRRRKWASRATSQIRRQVLDSPHHSAIPRASFKRAIKRGCEAVGAPAMRWSVNAISALQAATEDYGVHMLAAAYHLATGGEGKPTLQAKHLRSVETVCKLLKASQH